MNTDSLIRTLAADTARDRSLCAVLLPGLVPAFALAVVQVWVSLGIRPDMIMAMMNPASAGRFVLAGVLFATALRMAFVLACPDGRPGLRPWSLLPVLALAFGFFLWAWAVTPAGSRLTALMGETALVCLTAIPVLSLLPVAAVMAMIRHGATTSPTLAGAIAGLTGASVATLAYAMHCIEDSPLFYVTWYGIAILFVTAVSAALGPRVLRW